VSCAKTAEPIEMPFEIWTRGGPDNLDGVQIPCEATTFRLEEHARLILELCAIIVYRVEYRISTPDIHATNKTLWYNTGITTTIKCFSYNILAAML